jgi:membrane protein YqaA with SNARE-associated domain
VTGEAGLWALFASSFLAATLLPGGSEVVLFGMLKLHPGGLSSYLIGRLIPQKTELRGLTAVRRYGCPVLLLSWVPFLGDPLCVAAGWLRLNPWLSTLFIALGKFGRYLAVSGAAA